MVAQYLSTSLISYMMLYDSLLKIQVTLSSPKYSWHIGIEQYYSFYAYMLYE